MGESFASNTGATCSRTNRWPSHCKTPDEITSAGLECEIDESITLLLLSSFLPEYFRSFSSPRERSSLSYLTRLSRIDSSFLLNVARFTNNLALTLQQRRKISLPLNNYFITLRYLSRLAFPPLFVSNFVSLSHNERESSL